MHKGDHVYNIGHKKYDEIVKLWNDKVIFYEDGVEDYVIVDKKSFN